MRLLLRASGVRRIRIPVYSCPALVPAIRAEGVTVEFYPITLDLEPVDFAPAADEAALLVNYFGLKGAMVQRYAAAYNNIIIDQCQALFSKPAQGSAHFIRHASLLALPMAVFSIPRRKYRENCRLMNPVTVTSIVCNASTQVRLQHFPGTSEPNCSCRKHHPR